MLLRVPAASLKTLGEYGKLLKNRGVSYAGVVTRISFDYNVAHPALTFKPIGFLPQEAALKAAEMRDSEVVLNILGMTERPTTQPTQATLPAPASTAPVPPPLVTQQPITQAPAVAAPPTQAPPPPPTQPTKPKAAAKKTTPPAETNMSSAFGGGGVASGSSPLSGGLAAGEVSAALAKPAAPAVTVLSDDDDDELSATMKSVLEQAGFDDK